MKNLLLGLTRSHEDLGDANADVVELGSGVEPILASEGEITDALATANGPSSLKHSLSMSDSLYARRSFGGDNDHHATLSIVPPASYVPPVR